MENQTTLQRIIYFPITKIIIGILVVAGSVALIELAGRPLLSRLQIPGESANVIIAIAEASFALFSYILLFRFYDKRQIKELSLSSFGKNALIGFSSGLILQSLSIVVIYVSGAYSITTVNPVSFFLPSA